MSKRYPGGIIRKTPQTPSQTSAQGVWDMTSVTQAVKENTWPIAGVPDPVSKSLRFRASASAYLNRTPASAGNRQVWTYSTWVKRGQLGTYQAILDVYIDTSNASVIDFTDTNNIRINNLVSGVAVVNKITSAVYRDTSAWYHIVVSSNGSSALNLYVNGVQVTSWGTNTGPTSDNWFFNSTNAHWIGREQYSTTNYYTDGYLAEVNFIDGQALTPSSFGSTNDQTGVWQPIAYTGTYGTNGFYLPFSNTASTTTLGNDFSGNSNNWTTNNISLTSGSTYDSMVDVPTLWIPYNTAGDTGALWRGNYAVWNPLDKGTVTVTNANLSAVSAADAHAIRASMGLPLSGKFYWETTVSGLGYGSSLGIANATSILTTGASSPETRTYQWGSWFNTFNSGIVQYGTNQTLTGGTNWSGASQLAANDVLMIAVDMDNGSMWVGKNGTWFNSSGTANPATNTDPRWTGLTGTTWFPYYSGYGSVSPVTANINFGQRPFSYTPPSGFKTLCTTNLPTPTIGATASTQANDYFNAITYTGNGSTQTVTGLDFTPGMLWIKDRTSVTNHQVNDQVRGVGRELQTDATTAETNNNIVTAFNSNGFSLSSNGNVNANGDAYVAWTWKANGSGSSNTAGTITSTVSANTTAGFSVVTWTGNGTIGATVGHGLGVAPSMFIVKQRSSAGESWATYHTSIGATKYIDLNSTAAAATSISRWNNTAPSSSVITLYNDSVNNGSGSTYVAYCFAEVAGYSKFGSYTGNSSSDGPFVFTGFRPRYLLIKSAVVAGGTWVVFDSARSTYNVTGEKLAPNTSDAENSGATGIAGGVDFLSNGFKIRLSWGDINTSNTLIYAAFAEFPFKFSLAR